jgi:hypothetical protein
MISVPSACHTTTELSITAPGLGIDSPFMLVAVNTTCHIPTIEGESPDPVVIRWTPPICGCQLAGITSFVDKHCATALGAIATASTSATNIDAKLQFLDLMSFSSLAGENGILE